MKRLVLDLNSRNDNNRIIRSYSRFKHSNLPFETKAPIFLDRNHRLVELLIYYSHLKVLHRGIKQTLTEFNSMYWVTRGRSLKKLLRSCVVCKKINSRPYDYPLQSDFPAVRFDESSPFNSTGSDLLGPLLCKSIYGNEDKLYKAQIVIYTCLATRAVILDVIHNATTEAFINSFSRFINRRGCPSTVISDNGSVYTADMTQNFAANRGITWKFTIECAPWQGGAWERLVGSVKRCLKKVLGKKTLTFVELQTIVTEVEAVLNNRPIAVDYHDKDKVITPNHLLFGRRLPSVKELTGGMGDDVVVSIGRRKAFMDMILTHFWERWRKEHLSYLRECQHIKIKQRGAKIQVNDVVIVYEEKQPRQLWQMARVEKLISGSDGNVRGATVKLAKSGNLINRPTNKLYPILPCEDNVSPDTSKSISVPKEVINVSVKNYAETPALRKDNPGTNTPNRPVRKTAKIGEHRRRFGTDPK